MNVAAWRATAIVAGVTLVVSGLLIVNGLVDVAALGAGFVPVLAGGAAAPGGLPFVVPVWLTPLSATLVHAGWAHLALNLVMLVYCGQQGERAVGPFGIAVLYVVGAYAAAFGQWCEGPHAAAPMIGASGAISAVVGAYALLYGERRTRKVGPVGADVLHVAWLAVAWIGIQLLVGVAGVGGVRVAVGAHIGGFIAGLLLARPLLLWRYRRA